MLCGECVINYLSTWDLISAYLLSTNIDFVLPSLQLGFGSGNLGAHSLAILDELGQTSEPHISSLHRTLLL